jgi:hypothetical protein
MPQSVSQGHLLSISIASSNAIETWDIDFVEMFPLSFEQNIVY